MKRKIIIILLGLTILLIPAVAGAWNDHALISYYALKRDLKGETVRFEPLTEFLSKNQAQVVRALDRAEAWCRKNLPSYRPLPAVLRFKAGGDSATIETRFLKSIRVNPEFLRQSFVQDIGGDLSSQFPNRITDWKELYILNLNWHPDIPFLRIAPGDRLPAINVLSTASDIPDYGMDCGLFEDNSTLIGKEYGFGKQPFGDQTKPLQQLAPFHMPYYYNQVFTAAFPILKSPYLLSRVKYFTELARTAFEANHDFWGYTFAGLALHYVIDCCQPYHVSAFPGRKDADILKRFEELNRSMDYLMEVLYSGADRHLFVEALLYKEILEERSGNQPLYFITAIADQSADKNIHRAYNDFFVISVLAGKAFVLGEKMNPVIESLTDAQKMKKEIMIRNYVGDYRIDDFILPGKDKELKELKNLTHDAMLATGSGCRIYLKHVRK
jgi:hypothetical protein